MDSHGEGPSFKRGKGSGARPEGRGPPAPPVRNYRRDRPRASTGPALMTRGVDGAGASGRWFLTDRSPHFTRERGTVRAPGGVDRPRPLRGTIEGTGPARPPEPRGRPAPRGGKGGGARPSRPR